jgi:hypothetical protein
VDKVEGLRGDEGFLALHGNFAEVLKGERAAFDHFIDGATGEKFHDDVGTIFIHPRIENSYDVGVLDRAKGGGLLKHGFGGLFLVFVATVCKDPLDRNFAIQMAIEGPVDCTDTSLANLTTDFIAILDHRLMGEFSLLRAGNQVQL